nr:ATP-binding protein [Hyphomonas sp. Mor2]
MPVCLGDFVDTAKPISASAPLSQVVERFQRDPDADYFILVRDKRPAGLISRIQAFEFAVSSGEESMTRLPIGDLVTARALILKASTTVSEFVTKAGIQISKLMSRGCIIVEDKRFKGVLSPGKFQDALIASCAEIEFDPITSDTLAPDAEKALSSPLLGTLAHEIRTPLTAIMGLSEMLSSRIKDENDKDIAQTIVRSSQTLDRILTDTLDYASLEAGNLTIQKERADLSELADDLRQLWSTEASRRGLSFRVGFVPEGPHLIETDLGRIRQIASNLISNALKFTREGEVSVTISTPNDRQGLKLKLTVTDSGRGLSEQQRERFMHVFEQGPDVEGVKGWGLGLSISRALAGALGGQLQHNDNPNGGSIFSLEIPVTAVTKGSPNWIGKSKPKRGKFQLGDVLLVEDHEASAMVVINALEKAGWTVHHAGTLHAAESYTSLSEFQIILTDLHLPDGNAMSFIDGLRSRGGLNSQTPIVALTADISDGRRQACVAMGADRALKKPIAGPELVATIADVLMSRSEGHSSPVELRGRLAS